MPSIQKIKRTGDVIEFRVICDNGYTESKTYKLGSAGFENETEEQLMSRVAHHMNDELLDRENDLAETGRSPIVEAIPKEELIQEESKETEELEK